MSADIIKFPNNQQKVNAEQSLEDSSFPKSAASIAGRKGLCERMLDRIAEKRFARDIIATMEPLLEQDQDNIKVRIMLADAFSKLGKSEKAVGEWEAVMKQACSSFEYRKELRRSIDALQGLDRKDLVSQGLRTLAKWEPSSLSLQRKAGRQPGSDLAD